MSHTVNVDAGIRVKGSGQVHAHGADVELADDQVIELNATHKDATTVPVDTSRTVAQAVDAGWLVHHNRRPMPPVPFVAAEKE